MMTYSNDVSHWDLLYIYLNCFFLMVDESKMLHDFGHWDARGLLFLS